jgi:predicted N-acyltransferase
MSPPKLKEPSGGTRDDRARAACRPDGGVTSMPAPLEIRVVRQAADIDRAAWDSLAAGRSFADHRWLVLAESVGRRHEPAYVLAERAGRLVAAAALAFDRNSRPHFAAQRALVRRAGDTICARFPALNCEMQVGFMPGLLVPDCTDGGDTARLVLAAIAGVARKEHARSIRIQHVTPEDPAVPALEAAGYRPIAHPPNAWLDIAWSTREAYEASLARRHRAEVRRIRHRAAESGLTVETAPPDAAEDPRLRPLIAATVLRHAPVDPWVDDLLPRVRSVLGDDLTLLVARIGDRRVGCLAALRSGDELLLKWPGGLAADGHVPFRYHALMVAAVDLAIATGVRRLWFGPTSYSIKRDLGAVIAPRACYVVARGPLARWLTVLATRTAA